MRTAFARRTITPELPVFLAGFTARSERATSALDPLWLRGMLIGDGDTDLIMLSYDALGADHGFVAGITRALTDAYGIDPAQVVVQCTHTHAAVYLTGEDAEARRGNYSMGQTEWPSDGAQIDYTRDLAHFRRLRTITLGLVAELLETATEARLSIHRTRSEIPLSRRRVTTQGALWAPAPEAQIDDEVTVIAAHRPDGSLLGTAFHIGCHPTAMGGDNLAVSSEFPGAACRALEEAHPGAGAIFWQGCGGDIKPRATSRGDRFASCTPAEMRRVGHQLADEVVSALSEPGQVITGPLRARTTQILLPVGPRDDQRLNEMLAGVHGEGHHRAALRTLAAERDGTVRTALPYQVQVWSLGPAAVLVALESEVPSAYSLAIRDALAPATTIVLGYSNGVYSYIPTRRILTEGGYEADHAFTVGFPARFVPEVEDLIIGAVQELTLELSLR